MVRAIQSPAAKADLLGIWSQIAEDNSLAADRIVERIVHRYHQLAAHPESGERCDDLQAGLRQTTVENYVIFYHVGSPDVENVRVVHGARDLNSIFNP